LDGLRRGRIFAVAGDLISEFDVIAESGDSRAETGETLTAAKGSDVKLTIRFHDPESMNANGEDPKVSRVDVIVGEVRGPASNRNLDKNETTKVIARLSEQDWNRVGNKYTTTVSIPNVDRNVYLRVRGTNGSELEPLMDTAGESPWHDLWFYSNPIFVQLQ
jgi:hypothetical protein